MICKRMLLVFFILTLTSTVMDQNVTFAENVKSNPQSFQYRIDYDKLCRFIGISKEKYDVEWKKGKSISDIAKNQKIAQTELITFFGELQFKALNEALENNEIDKDFYYNYAISQMENDIMQVINQNPNKSSQAKEIKYNHNSVKIKDLVSKVDFSVLVPDKLPKKSTLEIKTYPEGAIRLHYMDKDDNVLIVGIGQRKLSKTQSEFSIQDAEAVNINGNKGYFKPFDNAPGGILSWQQDGTFVEMDSSTITKQEMIKIANSMKVAK
jgi:hypothetical protein